jgi:hypothetical protein
MAMPGTLVLVVRLSKSLALAVSHLVKPFQTALHPLISKQPMDR